MVAIRGAYLAEELEERAREFQALRSSGRSGTFYDFLHSKGYQVIRHPRADGHDLVGVLERRQGWRGFRARMARWLRTGGRAGW